MNQECYCIFADAMRKNALNPFFLFFILVGVFVYGQNIQVNDTYTAQQLVENVLINSSCAQVSNFTVSGGSFGTGEQSYGYFTNTNPAFPFANGVLLSTGKATSATGPNTSILSDGGNIPWAGDNDLNQALGISNTLNATILEFDFVPKSSKISFNYIFASEEYHDNAQCTYSDGFAFLLKKVGTSTYQNLALIPNTNIPVKVTTVHPDVPGGCSAQNANFFGSYNDASHPTNFNGQTIVMTATGDVEVGATYHIKLVIADEQNYKYDSAIFLGGGSFNADLYLGNNRLIATNNPYCAGENITLDATQPGATNTYKWFKNGNFTGITTPTFQITDNTNANIVTYSVEVDINGSCISNGKIEVQFAPLPVLSNQVFTQCDDDNDTSTVYNLTKLDNLIKNNDSSLGTVTYYESIGGVAITNPTNYVSSPKIIYAKVANAYGCSSYAQVELKIANNTYAPMTYNTCDDQDGNPDGIVIINPHNEITPLIATTYPVEYYYSSSNAITQQGATSSIQNIVPYDQTTVFLWARIIDGKDCVSIFPIHIKINGINTQNLQDETVIICENSTTNLTVPNIYNTYLWNTGQTSNSITINSLGIYNVQVTNSSGCKATKKFSVIKSAPASNVNAEIIEFSDNNSIRVTYTDNGGNYVFSIDGINYQESPLFENLSPGEYTIYIKDLNGCLPITTKSVVVLDYPKFFTPNNDGYNDIWTINGLDTKPETIISVFDRYGKLLKQFSSHSKNGWNGTYNGIALPSDDYWFSMSLFNGTLVKRHFTLKR